MDYEISLFLARRYDPHAMEQVLSVLKSWFSDGELTVESYDLSPESVTSDTAAPLSSQDAASGRYVLGQPEFATILRTRFLKRLQGRLKPNNRVIYIQPFVDEDDNVSVTVLVPLAEDEYGRPSGVLVPALFGEERLFSLFEHIDPYWGAVGVEPFMPTVTSLRAGQERLPTCGYYGSHVLSIVGRQELTRVVRGCPKVVPLSSGGVFFCWGWHSSSEYQSEGFRRFLDAEMNFRRRVLASFGDAIS